MTGPEVVSLPKDAELVELRPETLTFRTRQCILPGTLVHFELVMEHKPLEMIAPARACLVVEKSWRGYVFHSCISLAEASPADRHLIQLFIEKGRGQPTLVSRERRAGGG